MEFTTILMEGGEWSSFNAASVNEEADFMAKMFPDSCLSNEQEQSSCLSLSSSFYSSNESNISMVGDDDNVSFYSTHTKSNLPFLSEGTSLSARSDSVNYQCNEIYYVTDPEQTLAVNGSSLPVGFWLDTKGCIQDFPGNTIEKNRRVNFEMSCDSIDESETKHEMPPIELGEEDKSSDSSELKTKNIRKSEVVEKGKRNVRPRRSRKACLDDEENSPALDLEKEKSGECSSEEDLNGENSNAQSADNHNVKTRASRGSAVDPQSLYARKRRERINERLRILQRLVPNGTKVDISTMLEEAVHYVKFLELQIKLLSSDELWMYAPLAYNGMDIGLDSKLNSLLSRA